MLAEWRWFAFLILEMCETGGKHHSVVISFSQHTFWELSDRGRAQSLTFQAATRSSDVCTGCSNCCSPCWLLLSFCGKLLPPQFCSRVLMWSLPNNIQAETANSLFCFFIFFFPFPIRFKNSTRYVCFLDRHLYWKMSGSQLPFFSGLALWKIEESLENTKPPYYT